MISRQELLEEQLLRKAIKAFLKKKLTEQLQSNSKEVHLLSQAVRKKTLQTEAKTGSTSPDSPLDITAMNFLRDLLRNTVPVVQSAYKALTTDVKQRESYKAHILAAVEDIIDTESASPGESADGSQKEEMEEDIKIDFDDEADKGDTSGEEGFIEIEPEEPEGPELSPEEEFSQNLGLNDKGLDTTGRQQAMETMNSITKQISDKFRKLDPDSRVPTDKVPELSKAYTDLVKDGGVSERSVFKVYLLKNLMLYFDRFETELNNSPETPEVKI
jgi:hypothetical protein